jgi:sortase A
VLDGHHNIKGKVFKNLINVQVGDIITLYAASQERVYRVDQKLLLKEAGQPLEVRQANARYINPTADERLTLVTCWPATGNSHRLIIIARPVSLSPRLPSPSSDSTLPGWDRTQAD